MAATDRTRSSLFCSLLGLWIGGSVVVLGVATYNFSGIPHLLSRNPRLAERAGFAADDPVAMKSSLLWVHASELNRVYFEVWSITQLAVGSLALVVAYLRRQGWVALALLVVAIAAVAATLFLLVPRLVETGRALDFVPRDPPPPELAEFGRLHGISLLVDGVRLLALVVVTGLALRGRSAP